MKIKSAFQLICLSFILLIWSAFDRIPSLLSLHSYSLHVWFGNPPTPKAIYVGESYNATIQWSVAFYPSRQTFIIADMSVGLRCSGNRDGNKTLSLKNWIVPKKSGLAFVHYHVLETDLKSHVNDALCYLQIFYSYHTSNNLKVIVRDKTMSSVFRVSRSKRYPPLSNNKLLKISKADRILSRQIFNTPAQKTTSSTDLVVYFAYPEPKFLTIQLRQLDDVYFEKTPSSLPIYLIISASLLFVLWGVLQSKRVRKGSNAVYHRILHHFNHDIEMSTTPNLLPNYTTKSRSSSVKSN